VRTALRSRFEKSKIYTNINSLLVALNPYCPLPLYSEEVLQSYAQYGSASPGPHVFGVAASAYRGLLDARSQSVIISGESGAGKTETAKRFLQFLAYAATQGGANNSENSKLEARVVATSPLLEAFGNAQTIMNNNSSRYGKFLMLQFDLSGKIMGASIKTYLLEKTRVVHQSKGERNYHVFHYLCDGAPAPLRAQLTLRAVDHAYLGGSDGVGGQSATEQFEGTELAMRSIGFDEQEVQWVWTLLAAVLKLGGVSFGGRGEDAQIAEPATVHEIAALLGCDPVALTSALTTRRIKAGSDWVSSPNLAEVAGAVRDGMAKAMYSRIFSWMVMRVNANLAMTQNDHTPAAGDGLARPRFFIGILDIFGFEMFELNSLEQLCINYTNEKLQATFNQAVFQAAMEENAEEDVHVEVADMSEIDNQEVIELIEGKPSGILSILNEECVVPRGTDASFADKTFQQLLTNKRLKRPLKKRDAFQIVHFAGTVTYSTLNMLEKNKDPVSEDLMVLLKSSDEAAVRQLFAENADEAQLLLDRKKGAKFQGVVAKFEQQLIELLAIIESSETHFVRCIKPNAEKVPNVWVDDMVTTQLRCSGVMEAVRVIAAGFPDRVPHYEIIGRFSALVTVGDRPSADREGEKQAATRTLQLLGMTQGQYVIGNTKTFLKAGVLNDLRVMREQKINDGAKGMQAVVRGMIARKAYRVRWEEEQERKRREEEERKRQEEEERLQREEDERRRVEAEELAKLAEAERVRILEEDRRRREEEQALMREEEERRRQEEEVHRQAQEALEREREEEEAARVADDGRKRFIDTRTSQEGLGQEDNAQPSSTGFKLDMGRVTGAAQKAAELEPDMAKWTPRARPKDAPKQSARYQSDFKALPEDVLEYAVYLGMDPTEDADLLWIAEEALTAGEPDGWTEQMDPNGNLYYYNATTGQSSRQHPLDEYYMHLYLKLKMQRKMEVAGMAVPDEIKSRSTANLTTEDLKRMRAQMAAKMEGEASVQQQSAPAEVASTTTSISQALSMTTPRSTKVMSEKFGISQPDTDVRALLINPAKWAEHPSYIETIVDRDVSTPLLPAFHMYMVLNDNYKAFAFSASKRVVAHNTHYAISLDHQDMTNSSEAFCGKLRCNSKGTEFAIYDDSNDPYGLKTGKPRRELGIISYKKKLLGPMQLEVVMPRVRKDGACAQFRPSQPEESMIQLYKAGRTEHMIILRGNANVAPGGVVELAQSSSSSQAGKVVFQACKRPEGDWSVKYMHPLSCFQAFNIVISLFHNPTTAGLDALPAAETRSMDAGAPAPTSSQSGVGTATGTATIPNRSPLSGVGIDLNAAKPGSIINTASLEGLSHAVYTMTVQGAKVYSGLYNGNIQVWHMDAYVNLPSGSRPEYHTLTGHTSSVYALVVTERQLISASHDKLVKIWDLNTLRCRHTLKGHNSRVRALALSGKLLFSGSNDKSIKVWNLEMVSQTQSLESHSSWIRALASERDVLTSASKDNTVKVWDLKTMKCIFTFSTGSEVYSLAVTNNTVYGGCQDHKIRVWNLNTMQKSHMLIGHEGVVRCLFIRNNTLYSGGSDCKVKVWDLKTNDCTTLFGHTSFIRAVAVDELGQTLYSGADDKKIKIWQAR